MQDAKDKERKANVFTMNMIDFNLFKLKSVIFLVQFPVTFTLLIINVWKKTMPNKVDSFTGFSDEEVDQILSAK